MLSGGGSPVVEFNGRLCLEVPVSSGTPSSGALVLGSRAGTLLVEPPGAVAGNNELSAAAAAAAVAAEAVLRGVSQEVCAVAAEAEGNLRALARLDAANARARYAAVTAASRPEFIPKEG